MDLIHTFVYALGEDDEHFAKLIAAAKDNGGEVYTVLLVCNDEVRKQRIGNESRVRIGKLTDPESIEKSKERFELFSPLPGRETLIIDTNGLEPADAAARIVEHFGLATK